MSNASFDQQLNVLARNYVTTLPKRLAELHSAWDHLVHVNWDAKVLDGMVQIAHKLAGSGTTFQFPDISSTAKQLEEQLQSLVSSHGSQSSQRLKISESLASLSEVIHRATQSMKPSDESGVTPAEVPTLLRVSRIAVIEDDTFQASYLQLELQRQGYEVRVFETTQGYVRQTETSQFDLLLLDVSFPEGALDGIIWLEKQKDILIGKMPVIVISARSDMVAQMRAMRAGARAYVTKPLDIPVLLNRIRWVLSQARAERQRVLWVDDDTQLSDYYRQILIAEGYEVDCVAHPLKILEHLEHFTPDVIVMDYMMPGCNGIELASMLRQNSRFMTIPIIFVSASPDAIAEQAPFSIVGNAFLAKPIDNDAFLRCLRQQLAKARLIESRIRQVSPRIEHDRLHNQSYFLAEMTAIIARISQVQDKETLLVAVLRVDREDYLRQGHGFMAMASLADVIEKFLVQCPAVNGAGCTLGSMSYLLLLRVPVGHDVSAQVNDFHKTLQAQGWSLELGTQPVTLSMGVVRLEATASLDVALRKAEAACVRAAEAGGDRVGWESLQTDAQQVVVDDQIRSLLQKKAFRLDFQPIVNLENGDVLFEAFIRLIGPDGTVFYPSQFFPFVDTLLTEGVFGLDRWVIEQAIGRLADVSGKAAASQSLVIKLSSTIEQLERLVPFISNVMTNSRLKGGRRIIFALQESSVLKSVRRAAKLCERLRHLGCGVLLEDAGTTDFSAHLLQDLGALDFVKLGMVFGRKKDGRTDLNQKMAELQAVLPPACVLIASGVEDATALGLLWEKGVRYFQGYFIQEPGTAMNYTGELV